MTVKRHGLGRGLAALMPEKDSGERSRDRAQESINARRDPSEGDVIHLPIDQIQRNPEQPRRVFAEAELNDLASSIKSHGVLQPLIVSRSEDGYILVAGERRLLASGKAGLLEVPCLVRGELTERTRLEIALIENVQREDLSPIEQAEAYHRLHVEYGLTHDQIARAVGKSRPGISNMIRLLDLTEEMQEAVRDGKVTFGQARALLAAKDPEKRRNLYEQLLAGTISAAGVERETRKTKISNRKARGGKKDPQLEQYERELTRVLATPVRIKQLSADRGGTITIDYYSDEELSALVERLGRE